MDALQNHQQQRPNRFVAQDPQQETHQQGPPWYSSSYPSPGPQHQPFQHPPPPLPPHQTYHHPQQQQWPHQHLPDQYHQWQPSHMPPPPAPGSVPYHHNHPPAPPYPPTTPFPPPHHLPPPPPPPPPHSSVPPHAYPQPNQTWGHSSWHQYQAWEYPDRNVPYNNEEDWAARAKAWASSNSATENHHMQPQFASVGRMELQTHVYHDQSPQAIGTPFTDSSMTDHHRRLNLLQEPSSSRPATSSYATNPLTSYEAKGLATATSSLASPPQGNFGSNSSVYEQEVPSSYSTIPGNKYAGDQNDRLHMPLPLPVTPEGVLHAHSVLPGRSMSIQDPYLTYGNQSTELSSDPSDRPLDFEPRPFDHVPHQKTNFGHADPSGPMISLDHIAAPSSSHSWTPPGSLGSVFPQISSASSGSQFDSSLVSTSVSGHPGAVFGRLPGSTFQPSVPLLSPSFGLGSEPSFHHAAAFPGDANGAFNLSERPKKAPVPSWLIEEISKTKPVIASSNNVRPTGNFSHSTGADDDYRSLKQSDQADSKSIDSSRSTGDDEDDEDEVEAARAAAINQEIKRVLTEVLLKVTDELFEEIATKVVHEDDQTVEVEQSAAVNHKVSASPPEVKTPKAFAKVPSPVTTNNAKVNVGVNSISSSSGGDILGLANYESDEEETQNSNKLSPGVADDASQQSVTINKALENVPEALQRRGSPKEVEESCGGLLEMESESRAGCNGVLQDPSVRENHGKNVGTSNTRKKALLGVDYKGLQDNAPEVVSGSHDVNSVDIGKIKEHALEPTNALQPKKLLEGNPGIESESVHRDANNEKLIAFKCKKKETSSKSGSSDKHQDKKSFVSKESFKDAEASMVKDNSEYSGAGDPVRWNARNKMTEKMDGQSTLNHKYKDQPRILEDRGRTKDTVDERDNMMQRSKERGVKQGKKVNEDDFMKDTNHGSGMSDMKVSGKVTRARTKEDDDRKREQTRDRKDDRSRQVRKELYKSRQASSPSFKDRNSKANSLGSHSGGSSDEVSDNSKKRKSQPNKYSSSPSPTRSRRRQVLRSPHSKQSQRRHSPYSTEMRRRSRSRSPIQRRRSEHKR